MRGKLRELAGQLAQLRADAARFERCFVLRGDALTSGFENHEAADRDHDRHRHGDRPAALFHPAVELRAERFACDAGHGRSFL